MKRKAFLLLVNVVVYGCASRSLIQEENPIKAISNFYNRNAIVAAPTFVGNVICGTPFILLAETTDKLYTGDKSKTYKSFINNIWLLPSCSCGAVTGLPFIPISYVLDESNSDPLGLEITP
ncbi:hypothetical protein [Methylomonas sp. 11b]|uniref:hypothetical protein n=1 Tax=Methylomonas sp. 11b TaxID=1168169 RepID=UPI0012DD9492|nr:hypothetical protein [Methylomonas sp. 11b]